MTCDSCYHTARGSIRTDPCRVVKPKFGGLAWTDGLSNKSESVNYEICKTKRLP